MVWIDGTYDMVAVQEVQKYGRKSGCDLGPVDSVKYAEAFAQDQADEDLACVVPDITNPFYPSLVRGIHTIAYAAGYDVIVLNTDGSAERERRFLDWSLRGTIDCVVGVLFKIRAPDFASIVRASIAVVRIEASTKRDGPLPIDNLYVDNAAAAAEATRSCRTRPSPDSDDRRQRRPERNRISGYLQALGEVGYTPQVVSFGEFNQEGGYRATRDVLDASCARRQYSPAMT
jgi:LacI family transcriptional regulator